MLNTPMFRSKSVSTRSTWAGVAPSSTRRWASRAYGSSMRLPMKPKQTPEITGNLPMRLAMSRVVASTSGAVALPRTTSSKRMALAGLKKCSPTTS
ncbi:hypothetical protein D9M68_758160 [compost metagenome]